MRKGLILFLTELGNSDNSEQKHMASNICNTAADSGHALLCLFSSPIGATLSLSHHRETQDRPLFCRLLWNIDSTLVFQGKCEVAKMAIVLMLDFVSVILI